MTHKSNENREAPIRADFKNHELWLKAFDSWFKETMAQSREMMKQADENMKRFDATMKQNEDREEKSKAVCLSCKFRSRCPLSNPDTGKMEFMFCPKTTIPADKWWIYISKTELKNLVRFHIN